jgi:polyisoprenoid-binding protein YceI
MKNSISLVLGLGLLAQAAAAAPLTFDFKDPKGVNNIIFKLDAPLEAINGTASDISGTVKFDPAHPGAVTGNILVASASLKVPNPVMKEHMDSDKWLDVTKFPQITFEALSTANVKTTANVTTADLTGNLTLKGVTKKIVVPVKLTYLKDKLSARFPKLNGDLLVLRANFTIKRGDFGISPGQLEEKVSSDIALELSLAGAAPR